MLLLRSFLTSNLWCKIGVSIQLLHKHLRGGGGLRSYSFCLLKVNLGKQFMFTISLILCQMSRSSWFSWFPSNIDLVKVFLLNKSQWSAILEIGAPHPISEAWNKSYNKRLYNKFVCLQLLCWVLFFYLLHLVSSIEIYEFFCPSQNVYQ